MIMRQNNSPKVHALTRRQAIASLGASCALLATVPLPFAVSQQTPVKEMPSSAANRSRTSLHQEVDLNAAPQRIYEVLLDSKQFSACTGRPAEIDPKVGGAFTMFGGVIVGRNIELVPAQRIVQAWRPTHWAPGVYSLVKFELNPKGSTTTVVLDHTGFPEGDYDSLSDGWKSHYWDPLRKFLV
jgi:activator of HSP90 ATPase